MRWSTFTGLIAVAAIVLLAFRGVGAAVGFVGETVGFLVGLVVGFVVGSYAAQPFCREDGFTDRTKLVMAWVSFSVLFTAALSLALLTGLPGRDGVIPELAQGLIWGFAGFFWLTVLLYTAWKTDGGGKVSRFLTWSALVASGSLTSIVAAVLLHGYVLLPLSRGLAR